LGKILKIIKRNDKDSKIENKTSIIANEILKEYLKTLLRFVSKGNTSRFTSGQIILKFSTKMTGS
jgi:hypothetical protein